MSELRIQGDAGEKKHRKCGVDSGEVRVSREKTEIDT